MFSPEMEGLLDLLPCASCSAPGPHRVNPTRKGGFIGVCEPCRQVVQVEGPKDPRQELAHALHGPTVRPGYALA